MSGDVVRRAAALPQDGEGRGRYRQQRGLGVFGELQLVLGTFEAEAGEGEAEGVVGLLEDAPRGGIGLGQALPMPAAWEPWPGKRNAVFGVKSGL